jgi:hypothetical protein
MHNIVEKRLSISIAPTTYFKKRQLLFKKKCSAEQTEYLIENRNNIQQASDTATSP